MKISERFSLDATQFELDFVDIDTNSDIPLFIDPYFLGTRTDSWSQDAYRTLRGFFQTFVSLIREGEEDRARALFDYLHEPNETCLGLSSGRPRGNAIGVVDGEKLFNSIIQSRAVEAGVVEDLEDFRLFIDGIDKDKISDMTTNIIRMHLVRYTQEQSRLWGMQLQENVQSGFYWDSTTRSWGNSYQDMLIIEGRKILLTPKSIVSYAKKYTPQKYYQHFILTFLQHEHLRNYSPLVQHRKDGSPFVTKKSLKEGVAPYSKDFLTTFTNNHPDVFRDFKEWIAETAEPISNNDIVEDDPAFIAEYLLERLRAIPPGRTDATRYHRLVVGILEFLFYPDVVNPVVEQEIYDGRKRIDIVCDNAASSGFFHRLHSVYEIPSRFIFIECKNYSREVANPEIDQLSGRFSINTGRFGLLLCRTIDDMETFLRRCNDTYTAGNGLMLPIVDDDLTLMLENVQRGVVTPSENFLASRYREVVLR